jgi:hypothetical protein
MQQAEFRQKTVWNQSKPHYNYQLQLRKSSATQAITQRSKGETRNYKNPSSWNHCILDHKQP